MDLRRKTRKPDEGPISRDQRQLVAATRVERSVLVALRVTHPFAARPEYRPFQPQVAADFLQHVDRCYLGFQCEACEQQVVASGIDHPWYALRSHLNLSHQLGRKDGLVDQSGLLHANVDVISRIRRAEWLQLAAQYNALL